MVEHPAVIKSSLHEKSWLKNRVNSGKPKFLPVIARSPKRVEDDEAISSTDMVILSQVPHFLQSAGKVQRLFRKEVLTAKAVGKRPIP